MSEHTSTVATVHSEALEGGVAATGRCQVVVVEGPDTGRAVDVGDEEIIIGTWDGCDLVLTDDRVSRHHLAVRVEEGRFVARDLGSLNGTLYEGAKITESTVPPGATLKVGRSFLRIQPRAQLMEVAPSQARRFGDLVAESLVMREVIAVLELASESEVTVLLEGETGTGKELAARAIHEASARRKGPFVVIDCGALPATLLESELFGHVKGAFTGASNNRKGAFVRANTGTIFLDELSGVPPEVQSRLLRVIEERRVRPVGADRERDVDVRIIAASTRRLEKSVAEGTFRPDLYYRLSVVRISLPSLRQRREDIGPVVKELLRRRGMEAGVMDGPNMHRLMAHDWPGNVRGLRNVIGRAVALSPGAESFADLRLSVMAAESETALSVRTDLPFADAKAMVLSNFEQRYLRDVMARCDNNISAAARDADVDRKHFKTLLRKHDLLPSSKS